MPASIRNYDERTGNGKVWRRVTEELDSLVRLRFVDPAKPPRLRRPDVWLIDGHAGPPDVPGPLVALLHEAPWPEDAGKHGLDREFLRLLEAQSDASARRAALVITGSVSSRRQIIDAHRIPESRVRVIPHGVDRDLFHPGRAQEGTGLVAAHGMRDPYVVFVSSVHPRKNLPALRQAMEMVATNGHRQGLFLVLSPALDRADSSDLLRAATAPLRSDAGPVAFVTGLGEAEVAAAMAGATLLCAPSLSEGFGLTPLEAMASGTPVVVSDQGALPEVVGEAGIIVSPEPASIARGIEEVLSDPDRQESMRQAGLSRVEHRSWTHTAREWVRVLEEAASNP